MRAPRDLKPRPLSVSLARFSSAVVICAAMFSAARGATLFWDSAANTPGDNAASGAGLGGAGIWNTTNQNWWDGATVDSLWGNSPTDTAVFGGTSGVVTLGVPITAGNLVFNTTDYVLTGTAANSLTLGASSTVPAMINLQDLSGIGVVNATISAPLLGNATSGITLNGNGGKLTLNYAGTYGTTGPLHIRSGTLQVNGATSVLNSSTEVNFRGSGTFLLDNVNPVLPGPITYNLGALTTGVSPSTPTGGDGVIHIERTEAQNVQLTFSSLGTRLAGSTGVFEVNGNGADLSSNAKISFTSGAATNTVIPGYFARSEGGLTSLAFYTTSGFVRELAYNATDPLAISIVGGAQTFNANTNMELTGSLTNQPARTIQSLAINGNGPLTVTGLLTITAGAAGGGPGVILKVGATATTIAGTGVTAGAGQELIFRPDEVGDVLTVTAPITGTTGAITKSGDGTLILGNTSATTTNAFTGTTYVNGGRLSIRGPLAAGAAGSTEVVLAGGIYELLGYGANNSTAETLTTGKNVTVTGSGTLMAGRIAPTTDAATSKTLAFGNLTIGNQTLTADPAVYAAGAPTPPFAGVYALSFTGTTTFTNTLPATLNATGTQAPGAAALTLAGRVTGPVGFIKGGTGTLALTNNSTTPGTANDFGGAGAVIELRQGVLSFGSDAALGNAANSILLNAGEPTDELLLTGSAPGTVATVRTVILGQVTNAIDVNTGYTLNLNGLVTSNIAADLVKRGAGTLLLGNAANLFGGVGSVIDIQAGILQAGAGGALGRTSNSVQLNGGTFAAVNSFIAPQNVILAQAANTIDIASPNTLTLSGLISSTGAIGSLTKTGTGNLTLTNPANSFGGIGSTLDIQGGGKLTASSGGALGDPANTVRLTGDFEGTGTSTASQNFKLAQGLGNTANFSVTGANVFTLAGAVSNDVLANTVNLTKLGTGTLELTNVNTFGGTGRVITVSGGTLSAQLDPSLGDAANAVTLNGGGFRAIGTFSTGRIFTLGSASNAIGVSQGNVLTLTTAFTTAAGNALVKDDLGTLALSVAQGSWTGAITINGGAIRAVGVAATLLGATTTGTTINLNGGLELSAGANVAEPLTINTPADNTTMVGSSFGGVLRGLTGTANTYNAAITIGPAPSANGTSRSVAIGVDSGGTLNVQGSIAVAVDPGAGRVSSLLLTGDGAGNLTSTITKSGTGTLRLEKSGASTWTLQANPAASPLAFDAIQMRSGTLKLTSSSAAAASPGTAVTFVGGSTFQNDNVLNFATRTQTLGALTFGAGDGVVLNQRSFAGNSTLTFSSLAARSSGATGLFWANGNTATFGVNAKMVLTTGVTANTYLGPGYFAQLNGIAGAGAAFAWYDTGSFVRAINYSTPDTNAATSASALTTGKHMQTTGGSPVTVPNTITLAAPLLSLNINGTNTLTIPVGQTLAITAPGTLAGGLLMNSATGSAALIDGAGTLAAGVANELIIRTEIGDTLTISAPIGSTQDLTKSGAGTLVLSGTNAWTGNTAVNGGTLVIANAAALSGGAGLSLNGGTFTYQTDGDSTTRSETLGTGKDITVSGASSTIAVGKFTGAGQAANKTVSFGGLSIANQVLTISTTINAVTSTYGVTFTGTTNFTEALPPTFSVANSQASNTVQGLTLAGKVTSVAGVGFIKTGTGTLALTNDSTTPGTASDFGGAGALIDIQGGVLSASSNAALGNLANNVALNVNSATQGFRATGTFATDRIFFLNAAANQFEVTQGQVLTLNSGLNLGGATPNANALTKNGRGVLELGANSPATWTGTVTINAGAIRLRTGGGLGGAGHSAVITNPGAALQLSGVDQVYTSYPLALSTTGINSGGALENVSGDNLWTGPVTTGGGTLTNPTVIGASGGTLTFVGGISPTIANETQTVTVPASETSFTLTFNGQTTGTITTATADGVAVQTALQAVIGAGNVLVTGPAGGPYAFTFSGANGNIDVAQLTSTLKSGTGAATHATTFDGGPRPLTLGGAGNLAITTTGLGGYLSVTKIGTGTATIGVASTAFAGNLTLNAGTTVLNGTGKIGGTGAIQINPGSTLTVNDTGTPIANRLSARTTTFTGGSLNLIGSGSGNTSETLTSGAAIFNRGLSTITVTAATGRQAVLNINGQINNVASNQNTVVNTGVTPNVLLPTAASVLFRATNLGQPLVTRGTPGSPGTHTPLPNVAGITISNGTNPILTFAGQNGPRDTVNKGILPWALVDTDTVNGVGTSFATFDREVNPIDPFNTVVPGLNPIRALGLSEQTTILTANANMNQNVVLPLTVTTNFNSLTLRPGIGMAPGGGFALDPFVQITLSSGGILAQAGNGGITGGIFNSGAGTPPLNIWTPGSGTSLTIASTLTGGNGAAVAGLIKAGAGTLTLSGPQSLAIPGLSANSFNSLTAINQGTLKLSSGNNTLFPNNFVEVGVGGTLDLGGNSQYVQALFTDGAVVGAGGVVTSSTGTGTIVANYDNAARNWAGSIQGPVAFSRSGQNTASFYSDQSYGGVTQITGGTTLLRDAGALSGTMSIAINFAALSADNNVGTMNLSNRIKDSAAITLRGGTLTIQGRAQTESSETVGAISVDQGFNVINPLVGGTGINSLDLTTASLSRPAGSSATLIIQGTSLGTIGSSSRVTTSTLNGVAVTPTFGAGLTNNIVGGWAENGNDFLTYIPSLGFAPLNQAGSPGYDLTNTFTGASATKNVRLTVATAIPNGGATINALSLTGANIAQDFTTGTDTLNLTSGGLIGPNNTQTIGLTVGKGKLTAGGLTPGALSDLYVFNRANTLTINSTIVDNPTSAGKLVRAVFTASGGTIVLPGANTYKGGTVVNGGTLSLTGPINTLPAATTLAAGLVINNATVNTSLAGQIAAVNVVTFNGSSALNLTGDNTLGGLIFNNAGGTGTPVVNSGGTLSLGVGNSGVTATSFNVTTTSTIAGRFALPSGTTTFAVDPIMFNGVDVAPTQASLAIQSIVAGSGGITKTGSGVLQFNAQSLFTGAVNVQGGGIQFGAFNSGSRFAAVNLSAGTRVNLNGQTTTVGSLSGSGVVTNSGGGSTLTIGFDGTSPVTPFSGRFARFGDGIAGSVNITKIGAGTLNLTGANSDSTGTLSVQGGTVSYSGPASSSFGTNTIVTGGTLILDNTGAAPNNVNSRLGGLNTNAITVNVSGGTLTLKANSVVDTSERVNVFTVGSGAGVLDLQPNANHKLSMVVSTTFTALQVGGTLFIKNLPTLPFDDYDPLVNGEAKIDLGTVALNAPAGAGTSNSNTDLPIRPDIVASVGPGLPATGFVTKDGFTNLLRPLASLTAPLVFSLPEVAPSLVSGDLSPTNYDLSGVASILENTIANSVVLQNNAGILGAASASHGVYGPNATLLTQTVISGGILAIEGGNSSITTGLLTTGTNVPLTFHAYGNLTVNANVGAGTGGLTKSGGGTLTLSGRGFYTGVTTVNQGTLLLNGGRDNSIAVVPAATTALTSALTVNGGTLDLNGRNQAFGTISSNNANAGVGGNVTNSAAAPVTLTSSTGASSTFSGSIKEEAGAGALSLVKTGNSTLTLTAPSTYTGSTTIRGGGISLRDNGALSGTSSIELDYGALTVDNSQLNAAGVISPVRLPNVPLSMFGGTLSLVAGAAADYTATLNNVVTLLGGASTINSQITGGAGSSALLTLGTLVQSDPTATLNFTGTNGTLGNTGFNPRVLFNPATPPTLTNNIIGPWATTGGSDFASYDTVGTRGVIPLGTYNTATLTTGGAVTNNVSIAANPSASIGNTVLNVFRATSPLTVTFTAAASTLTFGNSATTASGGMLFGATTFLGDGTAAGSGSITSGGNQLYVYANTSSTINNVVTSSVINSVIKDGVNGALTLVKSGGQPLVLTANNTYTGGTVVNQGTLVLSNPVATGLAAAVAIPGDLLINNATTTLSLANQLRTNASVTLDGAGTLNTASGVPLSNTIGRVTFNNRGGNGAPTVATSTNLNLSSGGASIPAVASITSINDVLSTTPTISGNSLTFSNSQPIISTSGSAPTSLLITAPMHQVINSVAFGGQVVKTGPGSVALNPTIGLAASTTNTSPILSGLTTTDGLAVGMTVTGTGIPAATVISAIPNGGTSVQLSQSATASSANPGTFTFTGSTFTSGFRVNQGTLILASSSVIDPLFPNNPPLNGPVGVGTLTLASGASIMSDNTLRTLHNAVSVLGDFTFGQPIGSTATSLPGNGVNLAGPMTLSAGAHTISVNGPLNISTISGLISGGSGTLTKAGSGTLVLSAVGNTWGGALAVTGGVLRNGVAGAIPAGIDLSVATGAVFDTPGINQTLKTLSGGGAVTNSSTTLDASLFVGGTSSLDTTTMADSTFDGSISGIVGDNGAIPPAALSLVKVGAGTVTLTGANTYRGSTDVKSGTLRVALSGSLRIASSFTVGAGATAELNGPVSADGSGLITTSGLNSRIRGSSQISSNVTITSGGIIEPVLNGASVLTINSGNLLDLQDGSTLLYQADTATVNRIKITGGGTRLSLEGLGTWTLQITAGNVSNPVGKKFVLFDGDAGGTTLLNGNSGSGDDIVGNPTVVLPAGWSFNTTGSPDTYGVHFDFANNDIIVLGIVPEPGTGSMVLGSLAVALGLQRFRRRRDVATA